MRHRGTSQAGANQPAAPNQRADHSIPLNVWLQRSGTVRMEPPLMPVEITNPERLKSKDWGLPATRRAE